MPILLKKRENENMLTESGILLISQKDGYYLNATAALVGPAKGINSVFLKPVFVPIL